MKSPVTQSTSSFILTMAILAFMVIALVATYRGTAFLTLCVIFLVVLTVCLVFSPLSITADETEICVNSPVWFHSIPMNRVISAERYSPLPAELSLCASRGFLGYWGIFHNSEIGRYVGYFGQPSKCFLVRLDNGEQFVLGCKDPDAMVDFIRAHM